VRHAFITEHAHLFCVRVMCDVLCVCPAGYYASIKRGESERARRARDLAEQIRIVHAASDGIYGSIKVCKEIHRQQHAATIQPVGAADKKADKKAGGEADKDVAAAFTLNRKTVARYMAQAGIRSKVSKKFKVQTTDSAHDNPIAPNTLDRQFTAEEPDRAWVTDITYIYTAEGFLYLAAIMDLYSRKIIGWSMSDTMTTELVEAALEMAIRSRLGDRGQGDSSPDVSAPVVSGTNAAAMTGGALNEAAALAGLVHHSDRGVQYTSGRYRRVLKLHGIEASMSRRGNCYDNAAMESFWGKLKCKALYHENFATQAQAKAAVFRYIETFYNRKRIHASLGYVSPEEFEANRV